MSFHQILVIEKNESIIQDVENALKSNGFYSTQTLHPDAITPQTTLPHEIKFILVNVQDILDNPTWTTAFLTSEFGLIPILLLVPSYIHVDLDQLTGLNIGGVISYPFTEHQMMIQCAQMIRGIEKDKQFQDQKERLAIISEQSLMAIFIIQNDRIIYANRACEVISEYTHPEILQWGSYGFLNLVHTDDREMILNQAMKKQRGEMDVIPQYRFRLLTKSNQLKWLELYSKTVHYQGQLADLITLIDVTQLMEKNQALQEREERIRLLFDASPDAFLVHGFDDQGSPSFYTEVNEQACQLLGYPAEELKQKKPASILNPSSLNPDLVKILTFSDPHQYPVYKKLMYSLEFIKKDGSLVPVEVSSHTFKSKGVKYALSTMRDISERMVMDAKIRDSEERHRMLFKSAPDIIFICPIQKNGFPLPFIEANDATYSLLGYTPEEFARLTIMELGSASLGEELQSRWRDFVSTKYVQLESELKKKDGSLLPVDISAHLYTIGDQIYVFAINRDISHKKYAEWLLKKSEKKYRQLIETMTEGLIILNDQSLITYVNDQFCLMLRYKRHEILGSSIFNHLDESNQNRWKSHTAPDRREWIRQSEITWIRKDQSQVYTLVSPTMMVEDENDFTASFAVVTDVSDMMDREQKIKNLFERLENQNEELLQTNEELEVTNEELEATNIQLDRTYQNLSIMNQELLESKELAESANRAKSEFLALMSHELRTPLNGILGHCQIMQLDKELDVQYKDLIRIVIQSGQHLLSIIEDILDIAAIEAGKSTLIESECYLYDLVESIFDMIRHKIQTKNLHIEIHVPRVHIRTDKSKLRQILLNLISNATKFTPQQGRITVHADVIQQDIHSPQDIHFSIEDTGIGIDPKHHSHIFVPFFQVESGSTRNVEGTGLGLALCKRLVEQMGGTISLESKLEKGSTFYFTIPYQPIPYNESPDQEILSVAFFQNKSVRILIVDDEDISISVATRLFKQFGILYDIARNGEEAIQRLDQDASSINLILMDLQMPVLDGYQTIHFIKQHPTYRRIPVIAVTSYSREEDKERAFHAGCDDYISKPYSIEELIAAIKKWCENEPSS